MDNAVTIRLDKKLSRDLAQAAKRSGRSRSEIVREALKRQLWLDDFRRLRAKLVPKAQALGYFTDEDVFNDPDLK